MEPNQDEEFRWLSIKKEEHESEVLEFRMMKEDSRNTKRVCEICKKEFSSGKALGGHMSSHVHAHNMKKQTQTTQSEASDFVEKKKYFCAICSKEFLTMKALSGHMRCHPERTWKGINPPPHITPFSPSSSSSSTPDKNKDEEEDGADDLTKLLTRWPVTAKRGRKAIPNEVDRAVHFLMILARGEGGKKEINAMESESEDEKLIVMMKNKKKRKKMKLSELNFMDGEGGAHRKGVGFNTEKLQLDIDLNEPASW